MPRTSSGSKLPAFIVEESEPRDDSSAFIMRDPNKCIQCGRCIEGCNRMVVNEVLDFGFRGGHTKVICDDDSPMGESTCVQCGECVQLCPVGALIEKKGIGQGPRVGNEKGQDHLPLLRRRLPAGTPCEGRPDHPRQRASTGPSRTRGTSASKDVTAMISSIRKTG